MKIKYDYIIEYCKVEFIVDTEIFTEEMARNTLEFFSWYYDEDNDPIDEVLNKYTIEAFKLATINNHNTQGVIDDFQTNEGFYAVDGTHGIKLTYVEGIDFHNDLTCELKKKETIR